MQWPIEVRCCNAAVFYSQHRQTTRVCNPALVCEVANADFWRTAHTNHFSLNTLLPRVLSDTLLFGKVADLGPTKRGPKQCEVWLCKSLNYVTILTHSIPE